MSRPSGAVRVVIRTRPTARFAADNIIVHDDKHQLTLRVPKAENPNAQDSWSFRYDSVLHNTSQETVYTEQVAPIVQSVLQGYNGTIMNYGQTGAGKTFTQIGSMDTFQNRGITPRAVAEIFTYINEHPQFESTVSVSYVEIYQDQLIDLLSTLPIAEPITEPLVLVENKSGTTHVRNLRVQTVGSEEEALAMLFEGQTNRQVANHQLNRSSTRGHAIFTIHLSVRSRVDSSGVVTKCKLNLVDLAGSERLKKTVTEGAQMSESMYINRSLTYLEQVVVALSSKGRSHTPYRQSKLTHLLKDSLGGNCKTLLIANIYGEESHLEETISTLQFAARVRLVPNEASLNQAVDPEQLLKNYALQIQDLKRELAMHDSLASRSRVAYEPYSDQQRVVLMEQLNAFLENDGVNEIQLESVRQMRELLTAMKKLYTARDAEMEKMRKVMATGGAYGGDGADGDGSAMGGIEAMLADGDGTGDIDLAANRGIALGHAPDGAAPSGGLAEPPAYQRDLSASAEEDEGEGAGGGGVDEPAVGMTRNESFQLFKENEGTKENSALVAAKRALKDAKLARTAAGNSANVAKRNKDAAEDALEATREKRIASTAAFAEEEAPIIDVEEYGLIQAVKQHKTEYKEHRAEYERLVGVMARAAEEVDATRAALLNQFNVWYAENFDMAAVGGAPAMATPRTETKDVMDDDEQFEQLQMRRVIEAEPEALAFVRARKSAHAKQPGRKK